MKEFFMGLRAEFAHISWPSRKEAIGVTVLVLVIAVVVGYYLGVLDMFFSWLLRSSIM